MQFVMRKHGKKSFRIGERTESDHQPLEIELKATTEETRNREEVKEIEIEDQAKKGIKIYQENLKKRRAEKEEIQEEWKDLAKEIKKKSNKQNEGQEQNAKCRKETLMGQGLQKQQNETEPIPQTNKKRKHRENIIHRKKIKTTSSVKRRRKKREKESRPKSQRIQNETKI